MGPLCNNHFGTTGCEMFGMHETELLPCSLYNYVMTVWRFDFNFRPYHYMLARSCAACTKLPPNASPLPCLLFFLVQS